MAAVLNGLVSRVDQSAHPLLRTTDERQGRTLLVIITADRGLCGSFNSNLIKAASQFITERGGPGAEVSLALIGRKGRDFFRRRAFDVRYEQVNVFQKLAFADAVELADKAIEEFTAERVSSVYLVYNEFKSVMSQRVVVERLLPIPRLEPTPAQAKPGAPSGEGPTVDYLYEPPPEQIFRELLPRHVQVQVYRALLESIAAEHAARMTAMDAATRNSAEMIDNLTLYMNKVRQAAITREIIEVVSGAAAT
jgi:F-type H+-transporting ATPase subunit gamma